MTEESVGLALVLACATGLLALGVCAFAERPRGWLYGCLMLAGAAACLLEGLALVVS